MKKILMLILITLVLAGVYANSRTEYYFRFPLEDKAELGRITTMISIDNVKGHYVYAYANEKEWELFKELGYQIQLLPHPGDNPEAITSSSFGQIRAWDVYPTYDAYVSMMNAFATNFPSRCQIVDAGTTVGGRKILFARISNNISAANPKPRVMYTSTIHGDETVGYVLMLRLIDTMLNNYGTDSRITGLMDNLEIWINPNANPDGTYFGGNNTVASSRRNNFNNFDLNRNFPDPNGNQYTISSVFQTRQIETTHMINLANNYDFAYIANFHGGEEVVNYPWDNTYTLHADDTWYQSISRIYASSAQANSPAGYMTSYNNGITNGAQWYVVYGGRQDWTNYSARSREVTIEISSTKNPAASTLPNYWTYNYDALLSFLEQAQYGVHGTVKDAYGNPLSATITVQGIDDQYSVIYTGTTFGDFYRYLSPGTYTFVVSTNGYDPITYPNVVVIANQKTTLDVVFGTAPQEIQLVAGWNMISLNVTPESNNVEEIFADIPGLLQVKDNFTSYSPLVADHFNTLQTLEPGKGYWVNLGAGTTIQIEGDPVEERAVSLKQGWNFVGFLPQDAMTVSSALANIMAQVQEVRFGNQNWSRSQLNNMEPGKAYWIKVSQDCILNYPE